jgi:hypothetical protein
MSDDELDALSIESESDVDEHEYLVDDVLDSDVELGSAASTACSSPDAVLSKPSCRTGRLRWADLVDSDDDAVEVSDSDSPGPGSKAARWADLVDSDDELALPTSTRWADLVDSDEDF